jgi:hypothetical protein
MKVTMVAREEQGVLALVDSGSEHTLSISQAFVLEAVDEFDRRFGVQIERGPT